MDIYIGFDSAWTDNPNSPGAICAIGIENGRTQRFHCPQLVSFDQALKFIRGIRSESGVTLVALDQPTVVPNLTGMRPVERVAASLVSWLGGGVQPANQGRVGMFCGASPIWRFLAELRAEENPERARLASNGLHLMEVFPALALASFGAEFYGRLSAPKYNPDRRKAFRKSDWVRVTETAAQRAGLLGCAQLADWCCMAAKVDSPRKADQDKLDSVLCLLIALHWRLRDRTESLLLGDLASGYMVMPTTPEVRGHLTGPACKHSVAIDGIVSPPVRPSSIC